MRESLSLIGKRPAQALEYPLYLVQFLGGLWILSPFFEVSNSPNGSLAAVGSLVALKVYGLLLAATGGVGLFYRIREVWPTSLKVRRICVFISFFIFTYFTLLRILLMGLDNLGWTSYGLNAAMCAVIYLRLRWEEL